MSNQTEITRLKNDIIKILIDKYGVNRKNINTDGVRAVTKRYLRLYKKQHIEGKTASDIVNDGLYGVRGSKKSTIKAFGLYGCKGYEIVESRNLRITAVGVEYFEECKKTLVKTFRAKEDKVDWEMFHILWITELRNIRELNKRLDKKIIRIKNPIKLVETMLSRLSELGLKQLGIDSKEHY